MRLSEIKGYCGGAEGRQWWETRWRRSSLKFYSHLAPSTPSKFAVHTALCIAIETFLLMTTETSFPTLDKESPLPSETALLLQAVRAALLSTEAHLPPFAFYVCSVVSLCSALTPFCFVLFCCSFFKAFCYWRPHTVHLTLVFRKFHHN